MGATRRRRLWAALGLGVVAAGLVAAYARAWDAPPAFDSVEIWADPVRQLRSFSWEGLRDASREVHLEPSRWLTHATFALNFLWAGEDPASFRGVNLAIHALAALALFAFLYALLRQAGHDPDAATGVALLAAALFAWNPVQTQAVTYIWQRATCLVGLFVFTAMALFATGLRRRGAVRLTAWGGAGAVSVLAVLVKQNAVMLPVVMGLYAWLFATRRRLATLGLVALGLAALAAVAFTVLAPFWFGTRDLATILRAAATLGPLPLSQHLLTQSRAVLRLASLVLLPLPSRLSVDPWMEPSTGLLAPPETALAVAALAAGLVGALAAARRYPVLAFAVLWYFALLVPESTLLQVGLMPEHRAYVPSVGPILAVALGALALAARPGRRRRLAAAATALALAGLLVGTHVRNGVWQSPLRLWEDAIAKDPRNPRPHWNLGAEWELRGQRQSPGSPARRAAWDRAEAHYRDAIAHSRPRDTYYENGFVRFQLARGWTGGDAGNARKEPRRAVVLLQPVVDWLGLASDEEQARLYEAFAQGLKRAGPIAEVRPVPRFDAAPLAEVERRGEFGVHIAVGLADLRSRDLGASVELRCKARAAAQRVGHGGHVVGYGRGRVLVDDDPAARVAGRRHCFRTAIRSLASPEMASVVRNLLWFERYFADRRADPPDPSASAAGSQALPPRALAARRSALQAYTALPYR